MLITKYIELLQKKLLLTNDISHQMRWAHLSSACSCTQTLWLLSRIILQIVNFLQLHWHFMVDDLVEKKTQLSEMEFSLRVLVLETKFV
jgi:hypothetical protein